MLLPLLILLAAAPPALSPDRKIGIEGLQEKLQDLDVGVNWIYDDLKYAQEQGRKTGKPLLVTFRCVPCEACKGFDARVRKNDPEIGDLLKRFVTLRLVQMKGVDLGTFQFDYDQSWAAFFMNADGTIYGRYGTPVKDDPMAYNSMASFKKAMERALALHQNYPSIKNLLAGKQGKKVPYARPELIPALKGKYEGPTARDNCIHCHMINDGYQKTEQEEGRWKKEDFIKRYPLPENAGMIMEVDEGIRVKSVIPGSAAARAGIRPGDWIRGLDGQPVLSQADIQWVFHNAGDTAEIPVVLSRVPSPSGRGEGGIEAVLRLSGSWKIRDSAWRPSLWSLHPQENFWAPELSEEEKRQETVMRGRLALRVKWIPKESSANAAGLKEGDLIVSVDGSTKAKTARELAYYVRFEKKVGDILELRVRRGGHDLTLKQKLE